MLAASLIVALTLLSAAMAAIAQYFFKKSLKRFRLSIREISSMLSRRAVLFGLFIYAISFAIYIYALGNAPFVSFVYPIFSSSFIFILLISKYTLNEEISERRALGILLIIIGILIISFTFPA